MILQKLLVQQGRHHAMAAAIDSTGAVHFIAIHWVPAVFATIQLMLGTHWNMK